MSYYVRNVRNVCLAISARLGWPTNQLCVALAKDCVNFDPYDALPYKAHGILFCARGVYGFHLFNLFIFVINFGLILINLIMCIYIIFCLEMRVYNMREFALRLFFTPRLITRSFIIVFFISLTKQLY